MKFLPEVWPEVSQKWPFLIVWVILSESGEIDQAFGFMKRCTSSEFKVPWQKLPIGDATIRRKKDDATVKSITFLFLCIFALTSYESMFFIFLCVIILFCQSSKNARRKQYKNNSINIYSADSAIYLLTEIIKFFVRLSTNDNLRVSI